MEDLEVTRVLTDIRERVVRVETKIDAMTDVRDVAVEAKETAQEALQSAKSAHHRLDDSKKDIGKLESNQTWLWRTVVGAVIVGAISILWKGVSG